MLGRTNIGSGGIGIGRVKIITAASATDLPEDAKAGSLCIVTSTEISKTVVKNFEPTDPDEGMLWITVTDSDSQEGTLDLSRDGSFVISPGTIKQYVDGEWTTCAAFVYQDDEWVAVSELNTAFFKYGVGWEIPITVSGNTSAYSLNANKEYFVWGYGAVISATEAMDLSRYSTMHISVRTYTDPGDRCHYYFGIKMPSGAVIVQKTLHMIFKAEFTEYTVDLTDYDRSNCIPFLSADVPATWNGPDSYACKDVWFT